MDSDRPDQPGRLLAAGVYLLAFILAGAYLTGSVPPPFDLRGAWFYAAAVSLLVNRFLVEPFFTRPVDALATSAVIFIAATTGSAVGSAIPAASILAGRYVFASYSLLIVALSVVAILLKDSGRFAELARGATLVVAKWGRSEVGFGAFMIALATAAFGGEPGKLLIVLILWFVIVQAAPIETFARIGQSIRLKTSEIGRVASVQDPRSFLARLTSERNIDVGSAVLVGPDRIPAVVVDVTRILERPGIRATLVKQTALKVGWPIFDAHMVRETIVGRIESGTDTQSVLLRCEPQSAAILEEGELVEVAIGERKALYQVIEGTVMSIMDAGLQREAITIRAQKLGVWDQESMTFRSIPWLPQPGAPAYLREQELPVFDPRSIGSLPRTNYGVRIDTDLAVTHNTAIVGILGIGKTRLAWELIRRAIANGVKVLVLDLTGQYSSHFSDLYPAGTEDAIARWLNEETKPDLLSKKVFGGEAGNVRLFRAKVRELLAALIGSESQLIVLNPSDLRVSRLEGFINKAGQADNLSLLTAPEVTAAIAEALLVVAQERYDIGGIDLGKYWLVLEEAHSLVPERDTAASTAEHRAASVTAKAILQGRKYGYGCLLITQRTASVIKSILNQCNTVFGMRMYDATGIEFLGNYIGGVYSRLLTHLQDREAVVFGRASSCNAPVIVRLNGTDRMLTQFWPEHADRVHPTTWE